MCISVSAAFKAVLSFSNYDTSRATACQIPLIFNGDAAFTAALVGVKKCNGSTDSACILAVADTFRPAVQQVQNRAATTCPKKDYDQIQKIFIDTATLLSQKPADVYTALLAVDAQLKAKNISGNVNVCTQICPIFAKVLGSFGYDVTKATAAQIPLLVYGGTTLKTALDGVRNCGSASNTACLQGLLEQAKSDLKNIKNLAESTCSPAELKTIAPILSTASAIVSQPVDKALQQLQQLVVVLQSG